MIDYEEYKNKVYNIFKKECLPDLSDEEKTSYLKSKEDIIKQGYKGDVYSYENLGVKNVFTDSCISSRICSNLEELY